MISDQLRAALVAAAVATVAGLLVAQPPPRAHPPAAILIDANSGAVITGQFHSRGKHGDKVTWERTDAGTPWYVNFSDTKPTTRLCLEGASFTDSDPNIPSVCTINHCQHKGDSDCVVPPYKYSSALAANGPWHDPDIVVDPPDSLQGGPPKKK